MPKYNYAEKIQVKFLDSQDGAVTLRVVVPEEEEPAEIASWLGSMGWCRAAMDENTRESLFTPPPQYTTAHMYYRWYEAVAYEQYLFMTMGGHPS